MFPITYIDPVYRPPSEADSLILPVTNGCSWGKCTFCEMYTDPAKRFYALPEQEIRQTLQRCSDQLGQKVRRVFLADGDAMMLPTRRLLAILSAIRDYLPGVRRVSSYCLPRNVRNKSVMELQELAQAGLSLAYVGAESGCNTVLDKVRKGETYESTTEALLALHEAGIKRSVMILAGLGGVAHSCQHAEASARLANATQPEFLATLVVTFPKGHQRFRESYPEWEEVGLPGLLQEMQSFLQGLELENTVFRSDHASNWLVLKGRLGADKERLLNEIRQALAHPQSTKLRPAWARGL